MYDHIILSKIYKNQDYDTLVKLKSVKESLFQSADYLGMFDLLSSHLSTYGGFMADDHMDKFFVGERNSAVKDVWEQMKGTSVEDNTPILAVVELQLNSNLRHNIIQESHAVGVKLKTINNSESTETIKGYQSKINDLINASEKIRHKEEILRGDEAVENVKRYHEKSAQRGYFLSKYNIPFIDDVQGGVERGGFIGILASAKQRKSTVLRYIIYQQIIQGINCGIVTMEMSMESVREHCLHHDTMIAVKETKFHKPISVKIGEAKQYEGWLVDTPDGWVKLTKWLDQGSKDTIKITMEDGNELICTPDHKIETYNRGWVEAQNLTEDDDIIVKD